MGIWKHGEEEKARVVRQMMKGGIAVFRQGRRADVEQLFGDKDCKHSLRDKGPDQKSGESDRSP
jgi:hypothetical protein